VVPNCHHTQRQITVSQNNVTAKKESTKKEQTCKLSAKKGELDNRFFAGEAIRSLLRNCHPRTARSN
jgi:hypothetical protein